jgi:GcrA cell cycle regulator
VVSVIKALCSEHDIVVQACTTAQNGLSKRANEPDGQIKGGELRRFVLKILMSDTTSRTPPRREPKPKIPLAERKTVATLLPNDCRWPFGDPTQPDFYFCGEQTGDGCTYCELHRRSAFQPAKSRAVFYRPHAG